MSLTVVVQQLAALLKGGRTPARLWDELCLVYGGSGPADGAPARPRLSPGSAAVLAAARGAAMRGSPVAEAVRFAAATSGHAAGSRDVSYTHLDVYKRQGRSWPPASISLRPAAVRWRTC
ncbi:hypothetical protein [Arthrobacter sp. KBS0703]|uniref:hypothetical protein n=1 Tax=Arthrobacter sp. KBS0703 TaxID=1955698 RepID=UPI0021B0D5BB|nr:hypothetical protein [Arthrobacter sp. KBS0703]